MPIPRNKKKTHQGLQDNQDSDLNTSDGESLSGFSMSRTASQLSQLSVSQTSEGGEKESLLAVDEQIVNFIEELEEKRAATRLSGSSKLLKLMSLKYIREDIGQDDIENIIKVASRGVSKDSPESANCTQILSLCYITFPLDDPDIYKKVSTCLRDAILNGSETLQIQAINALCLISFLDKVDETVDEILIILKSMISNPSTKESVLEALLAGFCLLYTEASHHPSQTTFNSLLETFIKLLDSSSVQVRILTGECIALLIEALHELDEDMNSYIDSMQVLLEKINALSTESAKHISKADKTLQKAKFRDIQKSIEHSTQPKVELKFKNNVCVFNGWKEIALLNALRNALGDGLNQHFYSNPLFTELFNWRGGAGLSSDMLRLHDTTVGKGKAKSLREKRNQKKDM